jgi:Ala-tRNA(Pro) deacylase
MEFTCAERVREHLMSQGVAYELTEHAEVFTAQALAEAEQVPGRQVAKPVILMADGDLVMTVLAAPDHVSMTKVKAAIGKDDIRLAAEEEFGGVFGDCELGAEPPFGGLYGMALFVDERLVEAEEIVFNAGSHVHSMRMAMGDYLKTANPTRVDIAA